MDTRDHPCDMFVATLFSSVLTEHGGLLYVLPFAFHLTFVYGKVREFFKNYISQKKCAICFNWIVLFKHTYTRKENSLHIVNLVDIPEH